jgi:hypothetical protein
MPWAPFMIFLVIVLALWSVFWKGMALWRAAKHRQLGWFIVLLVVNTAGILEIVYILWFQKGHRALQKEQRKKKKQKRRWKRR